MVRLSLLLAFVMLLGGCSGSNTGLQNLQFSGEAEAFPADYSARALRYLGAQMGPGVAVSYPRTIVGETALSPRRWYICLRGLAPPEPAPRAAKPLLEAAVDLMQSGSGEGVYDVIVILRASGAVSAIKGFDAPLCAGGRYEALLAV